MAPGAQRRRRRERDRKRRAAARRRGCPRAAPARRGDRARARRHRARGRDPARDFPATTRRRSRPARASSSAACRWRTRVTSLMARDKLLTSPADRQANQRLIVDGIQSALLRGADARTPAGADPVLAGWLELGRILADAQSGALGAQRRLQAWKERYPSHPASESLWKGIAERPVAAGERPQQVALLLPLSGRAAAAGGAVRDGFLGAYYDGGNAARPRIRVYDVAERDAPSAYLQALADGCDFVVGPLTREEVTALATVADGRATTLALNFLPDGVQVPDRFYQFALSPEDEARLAARRVAADGRLSGVTLAPQSDWGRRVVDRIRRGIRGRGRAGRGAGRLRAVDGGLQRDAAPAAAHDRPARQQPAPRRAVHLRRRAARARPADPHAVAIQLRERTADLRDLRHFRPVRRGQPGPRRRDLSRHALDPRPDRGRGRRARSGRARVPGARRLAHAAVRLRLRRVPVGQRAPALAQRRQRLPARRHRPAHAGRGRPRAARARLGADRRRPRRALAAPAPLAPPVP